MVRTRDPTGARHSAYAPADPGKGSKVIVVPRGPDQATGGQLGRPRRLGQTRADDPRVFDG